MLPKIIIDGTVNGILAEMQTEYCFVNHGETAQVPRYLFSVANGTEVASLQRMTRNRTLERIPVRTWAEDTEESDGAMLMRLTPRLYCLQGEPLQPGEEARFLVRTVWAIPQGKDGRRLELPLGIAGVPAQSEEESTVEVSLFADGAVLQSSHPSEEQDGRLTVQVPLGEDLVMVFAPQTEGCGLVQKQWHENIGIHRLFAKERSRYRKGCRKKGLLLVDTASADTRVRLALREAVYRAVQALDDKTLVQVLASDAEEPLFTEFRTVDDAVLQEVLAMSEGWNFANSAKEMLRRAEALADSDTVVVLFSDGRSDLSDCTTDLTVHLLTVGACACGLGSLRWHCGEHRHCYPHENLAERMADWMERWVHPSIPVTVCADDAFAEITVLGGDMAADGYLDIAVQSKGAVLRQFCVMQDGVAVESLEAVQLSISEYFDFPVRMCAAEKRNRMERLLQQTDKGSYRFVKQQIEKLALEYEILSTETVFGSLDGMMPLPSIADAAPEGAVGWRERTIFGETGRWRNRNTEDLVGFGIAFLTSCIRTDGGIYIGKENRAEQTAYAAAALHRAKEKDRAIATVLDGCEAYLADKPLTGEAALLYRNRMVRGVEQILWMRNLPPVEELCKEPLSVASVSRLLLQLLV